MLWQQSVDTSQADNIAHYLYSRLKPARLIQQENTQNEDTIAIDFSRASHLALLGVNTSTGWGRAGPSIPKHQSSHPHLGEDATFCLLPTEVLCPLEALPQGLPLAGGISGANATTTSKVHT